MEMVNGNLANIDLSDPKDSAIQIIAKVVKDILINDKTFLSSTILSGEIWFDPGYKNGGDGSITNPYNNLKEFIESLPKYLYNKITLCLKPGEYGTIDIRGFLGESLIIKGADSPELSNMVKFDSLIIHNNMNNIGIVNSLIQGTMSKASIDIYNCHNVNINGCVIASSIKQSIGIFVNRSFTNLNNIKINNKTNALYLSSSNITMNGKNSVIGCDSYFKNYFSIVREEIPTEIEELIDYN